MVPVRETSSVEERRIAGVLNREWREEMNFKSVPTKAQADLDKLAREITRSSGPAAYAPPEVRNRDDQQMLIKQVEKFGSLPTQELDEMIAQVEREIEAIKRDAQVIRDTYLKYTTHLTERIKRLQDSVKLSSQTLATLRDQSIMLNPPEVEVEPSELPLIPFREKEHA